MTGSTVSLKAKSVREFSSPPRSILINVGMQWLKSLSNEDDSKVSVRVYPSLTV